MVGSVGSVGSSVGRWLVVGLSVSLFKGWLTVGLLVAAGSLMLAAVWPNPFSGRCDEDGLCACSHWMLSLIRLSVALTVAAAASQQRVCVLVASGPTCS